MRRQRRQQVTSQFAVMLRAKWLLKTSPQPMLIALDIDSEFIYVSRSDRLIHLHLDSTSFQWEVKRYTREPFGDYTTSYQPLGKGSDLDSLQKFTEGMK